MNANHNIQIFEQPLKKGRFHIGQLQYTIYSLRIPSVSYMVSLSAVRFQSQMSLILGRESCEISPFHSFPQVSSAALIFNAEYLQVS